MKKLISSLLIIAMLFGLSSTVFSSEDSYASYARNISPSEIKLSDEEIESLVTTPEKN